jgi:hypothetical protein
MISFSPPYTPLASATQALQQDGFALLRADDLINLCQCPLQSWDELALFWQHLEPDQYLKDGGKYRQFPTDHIFNQRPIMPCTVVWIGGSRLVMPHLSITLLCKVSLYN